MLGIEIEDGAADRDRFEQLALGGVVAGDLLKLDHRFGFAAHPREQIGEPLAQHHVAGIEIDGARKLLRRFDKVAAGEGGDSALGVRAELILGGHRRGTLARRAACVCFARV